MIHRPCAARLTRRGLQAGFSFVELLIVIACLAIAAMVVMPMAGQTDATRLRAAASQLIADLEYAQLQSMGDTLSRCVVVFDPQGSQYHLARHDQPDTPMADPVTGLPYVTRFGQGRARAMTGVTIQASHIGGDNQLGYTTLGALDQGSSATITLRKGDMTLPITIEAATGEPRLPTSF